MAEYYAVERSEEYLAHYGVKGMRWGVRKALQSGNANRLERQWKKANKKLSKLNRRADWSQQNKEWKKGSVTSAAGLIGGGLGGLTSAALRYRGLPLGSYRKALAAVGIAGAVGGSIPGAISGIRANNRLHSRGHAKAVSEAHAWANEMNKAFKGTKYQGKASKFNDSYVITERKYDPKEAKAGNAMPYTTVTKRVSGTKLARDHDRAYPHYLGKKRRR